MTQGALCDFCSAPEPAWEYPCRSFYLFDGIAESVEEWMACDRCHDLIEASDWSGLAKRASTLMGYMPALCAEIHGQFRQHRAGPPKRTGWRH